MDEQIDLNQQRSNERAPGQQTFGPPGQGHGQQTPTTQQASPGGGDRRKTGLLIAGAVAGFLALAGAAFAVASLVAESGDDEALSGAVVAASEDTDEPASSNDDDGAEDESTASDPGGAIAEVDTEPAAAPDPPVGPTWDEFKDAEIPAMCGHAPTRLVDGVDHNLGPTEGFFELLPVSGDGVPLIAEGLISPDGVLTAVAASCSAGGVGWPNPILFFGEGGRFVASTLLDGVSASETIERPWSDSSWSDDWSAAGAFAPGRSGVRSITVAGDELVVVATAEVTGDSPAAPSGMVEVRIRVEDGLVHLVDIRRTA